MDNFKVFMIRRNGPTQFATVDSPDNAEKQCPYETTNDIIRKETELAVACSEASKLMKEVGREDVCKLLDDAASCHNDCAAKLSDVMNSDEGQQSTESPSMKYQQM